jgi:hypothetical protein
MRFITLAACNGYIGTAGSYEPFRVRHLPLLAKEGWLRHQSKVAKPPKRRRRRAEPAQARQGAAINRSCQPQDPFQNAFRNTAGERPPLLGKEGKAPRLYTSRFIHVFIAPAITICWYRAFCYTPTSTQGCSQIGDRRQSAIADLRKRAGQPGMLSPSPGGECARVLLASELQRP